MFALCCPVGRGERGRVADGPPYLKKQQKKPVNTGRYVQEYRWLLTTLFIQGQEYGDSQMQLSRRGADPDL